MTETVPQRHPRVDVADALRGFAVLAIILLHSIEHFNFYSFRTLPDRVRGSIFVTRLFGTGCFLLSAARHTRFLRCFSDSVSLFRTTISV